MRCLALGSPVTLCARHLIKTESAVEGDIALLLLEDLVPRAVQSAERTAADHWMLHRELIATELLTIRDELASMTNRPERPGGTIPVAELSHWRRVGLCRRRLLEELAGRSAEINLRCGSIRCSTRQRVLT